MKPRIANAALWLAYLLALLASISHVAWAFGTLEQPGHEWAGWIAAVAVDAGLAALAYAVQQRKRTGRPTRGLWAGVVVFAGISAYANLLHALSRSSDIAKAVALSATLPLLVVYLGEVVSSDDAAQAERMEAERKRTEAKAEREKAQAERTEAARLAEEAKQAALLAASSVLRCAICGYEAKTQAALSGHMKAHRNGHAVETIK